MKLKLITLVSLTVFMMAQNPQARQAATTPPVPDLLKQAAAAYEDEKLEESIALVERAHGHLWDQLPLGYRNFVIVTEPATIYGDIKARDSSVFRPGEAIRFYVEPLYYDFQRKGDELTFGIAADFAFIDSDGNVLVGKRDFLHTELSAIKAVHEMFLNMNVNLTGVTPGKYTVEFTLRDLISGKSVPVKAEIEIAQ